MRARGVLVGGQDADLPPRHLLFVNVHRLQEEGMVRARDRERDNLQSKHLADTFNPNRLMVDSHSYKEPSFIRFGSSLQREII